MGLKRIVIFIVLYLLLECNFLYLLPPNKYSELYNLLLIVFIIIFQVKAMKKHVYVFSKFVILFMILYFIDLIVSCYTYHQGFMSVLHSSEYNLLILSYFIFSWYLKKTKKFFQFKYVFVVFSLILSSLFDIQYILYSKNIIFLNIPLNVRFETLRINSTTIIPNLGVIIAFTNLLNSRTKGFAKLICFANVVIGFIYIVFVGKVRIALLIEIICLLVFVILKYRKKLIKLTYVLLFLGVVVIIFSSSSIINQYSSSVNSDDTSYTIRQDEISYYLKQANENPIMGIGIIVPTEGDETFYILRGIQGIYYANDVGIFGVLQTFGLCGLLWYLMLLVKMLSMIFKITRLRKFDEYLEFVPIFIYILLTSVTLIILDDQRNFMLPIIMAMMEYMYVQSIGTREIKAKPKVFLKIDDIKID